MAGGAAGRTVSRRRTTAGKTAWRWGGWKDPLPYACTREGELFRTIVLNRILGVALRVHA